MLKRKSNKISSMSTEQNRSTIEEKIGWNNAEKFISRVGFPNIFRRGSGGGSQPSHTVKRIGQDDEILKRHRKAFDAQLRRVGMMMGKDLALNAEGMGYFSYGKFVVVVEVPADVSGNFFIYTLVCRLSPEDNQMIVLQRAMELNYMEFATRGSTLGLEAGEINLCYSGPIAALSAPKLQSIIEAFLQTAMEANASLEAAKSTSRGSI